jgi:hypothetical protein
MISSFQSFAQCNDQLLAVASERLENYNYVKDFKIKMKKGKKGDVPFQRSTMILNAGFKYKIFTASAKEFDGKLVADFFSQEGMLASTYSASNKKHYESIEFECRKTGVYYLTLYFEEGKEGCGVCVLSIESDDVKRDRMR